MATIENEIVSFLSKFVQNLESYRTVHGLFKKCPEEVNYQVIETFGRKGLGSFGFVSILRHADLIDRPDFQLKDKIELEIDGLKGKYSG